MKKINLYISRKKEKPTIKLVVNNLTTRIMLLIFINLVLITSFFILFGYYNQISLLEKKEGEKLKHIATSVALSINGDKHENLIKNTNSILNIKNNNDYYSIHNVLKKNYNENKLKNTIYTLTYQPDNKSLMYGVRSDTFIDFKNEYFIYPKMLIDSFNVGGIIPRYKTENGEFLSAFHPIKNSNNKVIAVVETDIEFGYFIQKARSQYLTQGIISLIVMIVIGIILFKFSLKILRKEERNKKRLNSKKIQLKKKTKV